MFDTIPTSVWLAVTTTSAVLIFLALWLYLWHSHLVRHHNQHIVDLAIFGTRKEQLETEIRQKGKWLDENNGTLSEIRENRQKYARLKDELGEMQAMRIKEEAALAEIRKNSIVLKAVVTSLTRERERMQSQIDALNVRVEETKLDVAETKKTKMMAALRTNKALIDLKTKENELQELSALYDKKYADKPSDDSAGVSSVKVEKNATYGDKDSAQTDVSSEIHISII
jgi:chromosome segregation ATPase